MAGYGVYLHPSAPPPCTRILIDVSFISYIQRCLFPDWTRIEETDSFELDIVQTIVHM